MGWIGSLKAPFLSTDSNNVKGLYSIMDDKRISVYFSVLTHLF